MTFYCPYKINNFKGLLRRYTPYLPPFQKGLSSFVRSLLSLLFFSWFSPKLVYCFILIKQCGEFYRSQPLVFYFFYPSVPQRLEIGASRTFCKSISLHCKPIVLGPISSSPVTLLTSRGPAHSVAGFLLRPRFSFSGPSESFWFIPTKLLASTRCFCTEMYSGLNLINSIFSELWSFRSSLFFSRAFFPQFFSLSTLSHPFSPPLPRSCSHNPIFSFLLKLT